MANRFDQIINFETECIQLKYIPYDTFMAPIISLTNQVLGEGCGRITSVLDDNENLVLKYPRFRHVNGVKEVIGIGIAQTIMEGLMCEAYPDKPLAKCKLFRIGNIPVSIMERIDTDKNYTPEWQSESFKNSFEKDFGLDGYSQRGTNSKGKMVCYDYGCEDICKPPSDTMEFILSLPILKRTSIKLFENYLVTSSQMVV